MADWRDFDTILLDMDGTILDLAFDSYFWRELVPRCMAQRQALPAHEVTAALFARFASQQGQLSWYCLDYWSRELDLDLRALKAAASHRVRFLPGAREFLAVLKASGKQVALVTNAHGDALALKRAVAGLSRWIDVFVSSHEFGAPKESAAFWPAAQRRLDFDPMRTLFIDDSLPVLDSAAAAGVRGCLAISRPDSRHPPRDNLHHASVESLGDLV